MTYKELIQILSKEDSAKEVAIYFIKNCECEIIDFCIGDYQLKKAIKSIIHSYLEHYRTDEDYELEDFYDEETGEYPSSWEELEKRAIDLLLEVTKEEECYSNFDNGIRVEKCVY